MSGNINDAVNITGIAKLLDLTDVNMDVDQLEQEILKTNFEQEMNDFDVIKKNITDYEYAPTQFDFNEKPGGYGMQNHQNGGFGMPEGGGYEPSHAPSRGMPQQTMYAPSHRVANSVVDETEMFEEPSTNEQRNQQIVENAMPKFINSNFDFKEEDEKEKKMSMLEQIDALRDILVEEKINIKSVQNVDVNSSMEDIEAVLKWLTMKNDRNRFGTLGEEFILLGCKGLEKIFDGKKVYFGSRPDLTGWSDTARTKLVRSRYHTSMIVSNFVANKNITPSFRLMLELVPNAILYAGRKKTDNTFDNSRFESAMTDLL